MVSTIERPIKLLSNWFSLEEVPYEKVDCFSSKARRERVSINDTKNTIWFHIYFADKLAGICALYLTNKKCRIKGDWIKPEYRGKGLGRFITNCRLKIIDEFGYKNIEVLTLHPNYYKSIGFTIHKEVRKGVWLATKEQNE